MGKSTTAPFNRQAAGCGMAQAVGYEMRPVLAEWSSKETLLYAIAVGCGTGQLQFCVENSRERRQRVLPTFAAVVYDVAKEVLPVLGEFDPGRLIHGAQRMTFHRELPPEGQAIVRGGISDVFDKGTATLLWVWTRAEDARSGSPLFDLEMGIILRDIGGWGGEPGPKAALRDRPGRVPDYVLNYETREDQALVYRLTGDRNPLHSDPVIADSSGFERPILHGLCTLGFAGRGLLHALCDDDPARLQYLEARFAAPVWPGDSLTVSIWKVAAQEAWFETSSAERVIIDRGLCRFVSSDLKAAVGLRSIEECVAHRVNAR